MAILDLGQYEAVRKAIHTAVDESLLPPEVIALPIYQGRAERDVLLRDPLAASYTAADAAYQTVRRAVIYRTAALLAPALPQLLEERFPNGHSYRFERFDGEARAAYLTALAETELDSYLLPTVTPVPLFGFTTAPGNRRR